MRDHVLVPFCFILFMQVEAGDMVLCKNDLQALLVALNLSTQTMRRIQVLQYAIYFCTKYKYTLLFFVCTDA